MNRTYFLLCLIAAFGTAAAQPLPKDQNVLDGGDQSAGSATPSRDTAPLPAGTGTLPRNTGADAGSTRGATNAADTDKPGESTVEVKPNAGGVVAKPPPSEVNPPPAETPKKEWPPEK